MKKKIISLCLVIALVATAIAGATLAYFTDSDADLNVMTLGNVKIVQNETKRNGDAYENQKLFPAVKGEGYLSKDGSMTDTDGVSSLAIWDKSINNEIDKFVSVTNRGTEKAYVRTILAFETVRSYEENSSTKWTDLHDHFFLLNGDFAYLDGGDKNENTAHDFMYVTVDGIEYVLAVKVYEEALEPGATTTASLRQFALTWEAGNEVYDFFGNQYDIIAVSQAVQTEGFKTAEEALNTAFGEINPENAAKWLTGYNVYTKNEANKIGGEITTGK